MSRQQSAEIEALNTARLLVEQIGNAVAAGLADPDDDEARLAEAFAVLDRAGWVRPEEHR